MLTRLKYFTVLIILTCAMILLAMSAKDVFAQEMSHFLKFSPQIDFQEWTLWPVYLPDHSLEQNMYMNYAWEISHDKEFLYLLKAENGLISPDRRHDPSNNVVGVDWGLCGINDYYHPEIVNDFRFHSDWRWQLNECFRLHSEGATFYGRKDLVKHFFIFR